MTGNAQGERFLVTGALGCIGAWTVRHLVQEGVPVVAFDIGSDRRRLALIMSPDEIERVTFVVGDITDLPQLETAMAEHGITNVIHLAALQVPFCRADPPRGARVNVVGTVNVFEAARRSAAVTAPIVYTSSVGMFAPSDVDASTGTLLDVADAHPINHYGVYKLANEGNARIYWLDSGVASVGLRPLTVFGAGRDQGMTSGPTVAIAAAVLGVPYRIAFGGTTLFQYAEDVARTSVLASRSGFKGAGAFNLDGNLVSIGDWISAIEAEVPEATGLLSHEPVALPFPSEIDHGGISALGHMPVTPYRTAIGATVARFREVAAAGRLSPTEQGIAAPA